MLNRQPGFKEDGAPGRALGFRQTAAPQPPPDYQERLDNGLTDGANDWPLGLELPQQKQQRGRGGPGPPA